MLTCTHCGIDQDDPRANQACVSHKSRHFHEFTEEQAMDPITVFDITASSAEGLEKQLRDFETNPDNPKVAFKVLCVVQSDNTGHNFYVVCR